MNSNKKTTQSVYKSIDLHINRKLTAAIIAAFLYALLFCFIPGITGSIFDFSIQKNTPYYIEELPFYLLIYTPFFLLMGTLGSVICDLLSGAFVKERSKKIEFTLSFIFHCIFGFISFEFGTLGAILLFVVDRLLSRRKKEYTFLHVLGYLLLSAIIGTLVYLIFAIF